MSIGSRIKNRRISLGMSVDDLAEAINKNRTTVYRYENGNIENLPTTILDPLATALKTTPEYLIEWEDDPNDYEELLNDIGETVPYDFLPEETDDQERCKKWYKAKQAADFDNKPKSLKDGTFGINLKRFRIKKALTKGKLSRLLKINEEKITLWESGAEIPDFQTIDDICEVLEISDEVLFSNVQNYSENIFGPSQTKNQMAIARKIEGLSDEDRNSLENDILNFLNFKYPSKDS
ncbi:MAG: helix-turn-helix transcriptional regulator [Erysipelotrichaceae bacterium]